MKISKITLSLFIGVLFAGLTNLSFAQSGEYEIDGKVFQGLASLAVDNLFDDLIRRCIECICSAISCLPFGS